MVESEITVGKDRGQDEYCVVADLLIPGKGEPIKDGCIIVKGKTITHVGKSVDLETQHAKLPKTRVKVLMPGMWDCHVHLMGLFSPTPDEIVDIANAEAFHGARTARDVMLLLNAGFTSVRELAGQGIQVDRAIEEGTLPGPNIYSCNKILSMTGGHGDIHSTHYDWHLDACKRGLPLHLADGVPECLRAVRLQLRAGAKVIKICASGGVITEVDNPIDQQFSEEEMRAMVEEAARARLVVAAHCHGKVGIMTALRAGVKTIEHGSYLDEEAADLMLEKGAILVVTRLILENGLALGKDFMPPHAYQKMKVLADSHWNNMQIAIKKGVKFAIGSDTAGTKPGSKTLRFDMVGRELDLHVQAGMTPLQAIEAATANGPLTLGSQAPKAGMLKEGFDADFIGVDENPLDDIKVLSGPDHVTHVWKAGKLYKSPGHPVTCI